MSHATNLIGFFSVHRSPILQDTSSPSTPATPISDCYSSSSSSNLYMLPPNRPVLSLPPPTKPTINTHTMRTRSKAGIFKPKALIASTEPTSVKAAMHDAVWKKGHVRRA